MKVKPKVGIIGLKGLPACGGAATVGENLVDRLKNEYDFTVYSTASHTSKKTGDINGYKQIVFKHFGSGGLNTLIYYLKSLLHCLINNYDLIHLHHAESGFITPFLKLKYKVIVTFHGIYRDDYIDPKFSKFSNWFFKISEKWNVLFANKAISVSEPDADYVFNKYKKRIEYIPNGILIDDFSGEKGLKPNASKYIFFAAGRIYQIKGLHLLLKAAKKIKIDIEIKIAGDLNQVKDYNDEIMVLQGGLNVQFLGLIKDKKKLMQLVSDAEIFVFPSLTEAMSMMLLEVVSSKTPVIASDIPSNKAIFNEEEMLFFSSENSDDLAEKIKYALENKNVMSDKAEKAYSKIRNNFTWDIISCQYSKIYKNLIKQ